MRFTFEAEDRKEADVYPRQWMKKKKKRIKTSLVDIWAVLVSILGIIQCLESLRLKKCLTGQYRFSGEPQCHWSHL